MKTWIVTKKLVIVVIFFAVVLITGRFIVDQAVSLLIKNCSSAENKLYMKENSDATIQKVRVDEFCKLYHQGDMDHTIKLGIHILTDKKSKVAYCFAPKVGCTHLKAAFLQAQGLFPDDGLTRTDTLPLQDSLHIKVKYRKTLLANTLKKSTASEQKFVFDHFYKFIMYRHPVERLLSSYRSKLEGYPLHKNDKSPFKDVRLEIFKFTNASKYENWNVSGRNESILIKFSDFINYWASGQIQNVHFLLIYDICQPCKIRYDYYGNFKHFNRDAEILLRHQGANLTLLRQSYYAESGKTTRELAPEYYSQLSNEQKLSVLKILALDLRFYYNLFPDEEGSHKIIMATNFDVPNPF